MRRLLLLVVLLGVSVFLVGGHPQPEVGIPFSWRAAAGTVGSWSTVNKFGNNSDVDNTEEAVWEGNDFSSGPVRCPVDTSAFTLEISSSDANDTEANNVDIVVEGLDENWDAKSITVTAAGNTDGDGGLAGLTFVQVGAASSWMRVNRARNSGTGDVDGVIYLHTDNDADAGSDGIPDDPANQVKAIVNTGEDQTLQACYTIPDGFRAYVKNFCASALAGGAGNPVTFRFRHFPNQEAISNVQTKWTLANGTRQCQVYDPPVVHAARHMLEITAISTGASSNAGVSGTFDILLEPL